MTDTHQPAAASVASPFATPGSAPLNGSPHLAPIARPAITDEIVNRLISLILDERLKPGDRLPSEHSLMAQLAVSRPSLREAIKTLRAIGVVEVVNGSGMFVGRGSASLGSKPLSWAPLSWGLLLQESGARELIDARRLIEAELASLAARQATPEEIATIGRLAVARPEPFDAETNSRAAVEFHLAVARGAHNTALSYFLEGLQHILRVWIRNTFQPSPQDDPEEHVAIYQAIRARDAVAARQAMVAHLDAAGERLLRFLSKTESNDDGEPRNTRLAWAWPEAESA